MPSNKAFTLVEMAVVTFMLGFLALAITGLLTAGQRAWTKQTKDTSVLRDVGWAIEYIVNDLRMANAATLSSNGNDISFRNPLGNIVYSCNMVVDSNGKYTLVRRLESVNSPVLRFIPGDNPGGVEIFDYDSANSLVTICITAQARVSTNSSFSRDFPVRTKVRVKNQ